MSKHFSGNQVREFVCLMENLDRNFRNWFPGLFYQGLDRRYISQTIQLRHLYERKDIVDGLLGMYKQERIYTKRKLENRRNDKSSRKRKWNYTKENMERISNITQKS